MAVHKEIVNHNGWRELFVWMNGDLLYKKWLNRDKGIVFYNNLGA